MTFRATWVFGGLLLCASCSSAQAEPAPIASTSCDVVLSTRVAVRARWQYTVQVLLENVSGRGLTFGLPERCPAGPIQLEGLPEGYDYYQTCNKGACRAAGTTETIQLGARERRVLTTFTVLASGGVCNAPLDPGVYQIRPVAPMVPLRVCVESSRIDLRGMAPRFAPPPPRVTAPGPAVSPAGDPRACSRSEDCVISCPAVPGCCGNPCGCRNAIHRDHVALYAEQYASSCTRPPHCLAMGCPYEPAFGAECRNGRCEAVLGVRAGVGLGLGF